MSDQQIQGQAILDALQKLAEAAEAAAKLIIECEKVKAAPQDAATSWGAALEQLAETHDLDLTIRARLKPKPGFARPQW